MAVRANSEMLRRRAERAFAYVAAASCRFLPLGSRDLQRRATRRLHGHGPARLLLSETPQVSLRSQQGRGTGSPVKADRSGPFQPRRAVHVTVARDRALSQAPCEPQGES
jgi:hypothetical protein